MRSLWLVLLVACRGQPAPLAVDARGTFVPAGAHVVVQTSAGAKLSIDALPDQIATADASGRATFEIPVASVEKLLDASIAADLGDRHVQAQIRFAGGLYAAGTKFRCLADVACSGTVEYPNVAVKAPAGTVIRIGASEHTIDPQHERFTLDAVAVVDRVALTAVLGISAPVTTPLEIAPPKGAALHGTVTLPAEQLAHDLARRLGMIETQPLAKRDASTSGGLLVSLPENPTPDHTDDWLVRSINGAEHPRSAKVVMLAIPVRAHQACGKYRDPTTRKIVPLQLDVLDLDLKSYDPGNGNLIKKQTVKALRRCPARAKAIALAGKGGILARYDEHTADKAIQQLAR